MASTARLVVDLIARTTKFEKGLQRAERRLARVGRRMDNIGRRISMGLSLPLLGVGIASGKMAADFDDSMTKIVSLVGVSREQVDAWKEEVLDLAVAAGKGPKELAEGLFFVTSAGFRGAEAMNVLKASAMASAAGLGAVASVADASTSAIIAYGKENLGAAEATAILVAAVREGKAEASAIAPVIGRILPIASELGITFDQVAASVAALTRINSNASEAITALRGIMKTLLKPSEQAQKALEDMKLSAEGLRKQIREGGLLSVLQTLKGRFAGNEQAMAKLFEDMEGYVGVLSLVGKNAKETQKIFDSLAKTTEADLIKAFKAAQNDAFRFRQAMALLQVTAIRFGSEILPVIIPALNTFMILLKQGAERFNELTPAAKKAVLAIGGIVIVAGPVLVAIGAIISAIAALASPFVLTAALMTTAAVMIIKNWAKVAEGIKIIAMEIKSQLRGLVEQAGVTIPIFGRIVAQMFLDWADVAQRYAPEIQEQLHNLTRGITEDTEQAFADMKASLAGFLADIKAGAKQMGDEIELGVAASNSALAEMQKKLGETANEATSLAKTIKVRMESIKESGAGALGRLTAELVLGEKSFHEWGRAAVMEIAKVIAQMAIMASVKSSMGRAFGVGMVGSFFGGFAQGGRPGVGEASWVGEEGRELFVPDVAGTIIPHDQLAMAGAGGPSIVLTQNFTMTGIDIGSQSTARRLLRTFSGEAQAGAQEAIDFAIRSKDLGEKYDGRSR